MDTTPKEKYTCPICFEHMHHAERTPCGHVYCATCIQKWKEKSATCPICRSSLYHGPHITDTGYKAVMMLHSKLMGAPIPRASLRSNR